MKHTGIAYIHKHNEYFYGGKYVMSWFFGIWILFLPEMYFTCEIDYSREVHKDFHAKHPSFLLQTGRGLAKC